MRSGNKIYDAITRLDDPAAAVRSLSNVELRALCACLDGLPDAGIPFLVKALAGEQCETRFCNHEPDKPNK